MYYIIKWIHLKYVLYYKMNSLKVCTILWNDSLNVYTIL